MASFVGTTVCLTPRSGQPFIGTIVSVNQGTATLSVRRADSGKLFHIRRNELLDVSTVNLNTPSASQTIKPASSMSTPDLSASEKKKRNRKETERAGSPAPSSASFPAVEAAKVASSAASTAASAAASVSAASASASTPSAAPALASCAASSTPPSFQDDFDFVKSAQNFDKKKIWEEIRVCTLIPTCLLYTSPSPRDRG